MSRATNEAGFTLIELMVSTVIIGILAIIISDFYSQRLADYARNFTLNTLQANTKQAIETMERDVKAARSIEAANVLPDSNSPCSPTNQFCWQSNGNSPSTLVLAVPARDSSQNLLYGDTLHNVLITNDVIYYIDSTSKTLYRRVIANPASGNAAISTCPPSIATGTCPADGKIIEDVANLVIGYYDTNNAVITTPGNSYSISISLQQSRTSFGKTYTNILTSRASLRNKP